MRARNGLSAGLIAASFAAAACSSPGANEKYASVSSAATPTPIVGDVLTQRVDNGRTGATSFAGLNTTSFSAANDWGLLATLRVTGNVWSQPLFVQQVTVSDGTVRDLIIIATALNNVYAFDANSYALVWSAPLGPPDLNVGAAFVPSALNADGTNDGTSVGILSTPVVDRQNGWIDVSYRTNAGGTSSQHLAALSLAAGTVTLDHAISDLAMVPSGATNSLSTGWSCGGKELCGSLNGVYQRASLLLSNGILYVAFTLRDEEFWTWTKDPTQMARGQINAYNADTLAFLGSFMTVDGSPTRMGGGIWQASVGPAADANGDVYFATGNAMSYVATADAGGGLIDPDECAKTSSACPETSNPHPGDYVPETGSYGNAVVRLHAVNAEQGASGFSFSPVTSFTPNRSYWHNVEDIDLGSSGPMLVPGTNQLVHGGKEGILYVLDRNDMGDLPSPIDGGGPVEIDAGSYLNQSGYMGWAADAAAPTSAPSNCPPGMFHRQNTARYVPSNTPGEVGPIQVIDVGQNFDIERPLANCWMDFPHIHGTASFATFANGSSYLYIWPEKDFLKAYKATSLSPLTFGPVPATGDSTSPLPMGMPGGALAVSSDPTAGGGVVFASSPMDVDGGPASNGNRAWIHGTLRAFNAVPTEGGKLTQLWSDLAEPPYFYAKFVPPTIAKNHVIEATFSNQVRVYGPGATAIAMYAPTSTVVGMAPEGVGQTQTTAAFVANDGAVHVLWKGDGDGWSPAHDGQITAPSIATPGTPVTLTASGAALHAVFVDANANVHWLSRSVPSAWVDRGAVSSAKVGAASLGALLEPNSALPLQIFVVEGDDVMHVLSQTGGGTFTDTAIASTGATFSGNGNVATTVTSGTELDAFAVDTSGTLHRFESQLVSGAWTTWTPSTLSGANTFPSGAPLAAGTAPTLGVYGVDINGTLTGVAEPSPGGASGLNGFALAYFTPPGYAPVGARVAVGSTLTPTGGTTNFLYVVGHPGDVDAFTLPAPPQSPTSPFGPLPQNSTAAMAAHTRSFGVSPSGAPVAAFGNDVIVAGSGGLFAIPYVGGQVPAGSVDANAATGADAWSNPILLSMSAPTQLGILVPQLETIAVAGATAPLQTWVSADFNGDGRADVANIWSATQGGPLGIDVYANQGNGSFVWEPGWAKAGSSGNYLSTEKWVVGDYNDDGRPDLANIWAPADGDSLGIDVYLNENNAFTFEPQWGKVGSTGGFLASEKWVSGDFNHDGWTDLANVWSPTELGQIGVDVYINDKASSFTLEPQWGAPQTQGIFSVTQSWFAGDFNDDGWPDLANVWDESVNGVLQIGIDVHLNTKANGFLWSPQWGEIGNMGVWDPTEKWMVGDFNADGWPDLAKAFSDDNSGFVSIDVHPNNKGGGTNNQGSFGVQRVATMVGRYNGGAQVFSASAVPSMGFDVGQTWFAGLFHADGLDFAYVYPNGNVAGIGELYR